MNESQQAAQEPSKKAIIEIKGLTTSIDKEIIHHDLNLQVYKGEVFAIVGGSGSGKTMLLRTILMLQKAQGSIKLFGQEIIHSDEKTKQRLRQKWGVMFQQGALFSSLTVLENIAFPLKEYTQLSKRDIEEIAMLKVLLVGLSSEALLKYPSQLSGGMQKRVALARAISLDPELLFLDEPTAGLDPKSSSALDELVLYLRATLGLTIVIITHDLDTLWRITDRVAFLGNKRVLQVGSMDELYQSKIPEIHNYFSDPRSQVARKIKKIEEPEQS